MWTFYWMLFCCFFNNYFCLNFFECPKNFKSFFLRVRVRVRVRNREREMDIKRDRKKRDRKKQRERERNKEADRN